MLKSNFAKVLDEGRVLVFKNYNDERERFEVIFRIHPVVGYVEVLDTTLGFGDDEKTRDKVFNEITDEKAHETALTVMKEMGIDSLNEEGTLLVENE